MFPFFLQTFQIVVNIAPKYHDPPKIAKMHFIIIACTFRHSEQHNKSCTELKHGKVKISDIK